MSFEFVIPHATYSSLWSWLLVHFEPWEVLPCLTLSIFPKSLRFGPLLAWVSLQPVSEIHLKWPSVDGVPFEVRCSAVLNVSGMCCGIDAFPSLCSVYLHPIDTLSCLGVSVSSRCWESEVLPGPSIWPSDLHSRVHGFGPCDCSRNICSDTHLESLWCDTAEDPHRHGAGSLSLYHHRSLDAWSRSLACCTTAWGLGFGKDFSSLILWVKVFTIG